MLREEKKVKNKTHNPRKKTLLKRLTAALIIIGGVAVMAYPFIANEVYENRAQSIVESYEEQVDEMENEEIEAALADAVKYNEELLNANVQLQDPFSEELIGMDADTYESLLNVNGDGLMGIVKIPRIDVELPIYHTTSSDVLEKGIGHLEGTSLPVGGESTHSVLTGHTGLSNKKLFTDLTELEEGDIFFIKILGQTLAYEVDQILVVEPTELSALEIIEGEDLCTLITCTPYGINSHRLFVRGHRTEYTEELENEVSSQVAATSQWMTEYRRALIIAFLLIVVVLLVLYIVNRKRTKKNHEKKNL